MVYCNFFYKYFFLYVFFVASFSNSPTPKLVIKVKIKNSTLLLVKIISLAMAGCHDILLSPYVQCPLQCSSL